MRLYRVWMLLLLVLLLAGCAGIPSIGPSADPTNPIKRLAILPLKNDTTDVDAPNFVREKLVAAFERRLYNVQPVAETDQILRDQLGITLGGQLSMASVSELREALQVEGLLYGTLMDYGEVTTGLVNMRKVRGKFNIVETETETIFWENGIGIRSQDTSGGMLGSLSGAAAAAGGDESVPWVTIESTSSNDSILDGLAKGLTTKLVSKALGVHLERETNEMIWRIVQNLPWGPGQTAATYIAAAPKVPMMPKIEMPPPPAIGHMNYGDRDFKAVMVSSTLDKSNQREITFEIPIAQAGEKFRMEIDYAKMTGTAGMPPGMSNVVMIHRLDEKRTYSLYTNKKKYMISEETDDGYIDEPDMERTFIGTETIDGHPTEKYEVVVSYEGQDTQTGYIWNATDLDGMTIRSEFDNPAVRVTSTLTQIVLGTPSADLFEIPMGYTETDNFMEIIAE